MQSILFRCYLICCNVLMLVTSEITVKYLRRNINQRVDIFQTTFKAPTAARCCLECLGDEGAIANYNAETSECQMVEHLKLTSSLVIDISGWSMYANLGCPVGWDLFGVSCFILITEPQNLAIAKTTCEQFEGTLARIKSAEEQGFVADKIEQSNGAGMWFYIDGNPGMTGETWYWSDGQLMTYFNWNTNQPDGDWQHAIAIRSDLNNTWHDVYDYETIYSVCEMSASAFS